MLAISKDKMDMDSAIRQTYDENCEDMVTHIGCVSLFCELGLASAEDLCAERISKDMVLDEELGATVLTHVGDCSLFIEHDMDTCPEFQASCFANNPCNHGVSLTKLLQSTGCTQDLKSIGSVSVYGFTPSILSQIIRERTTKGLHIDWDPGGFTIASLPLNRTPFAEHNIVYSKNNLLMNFKGCGDNNTIVLAAEHYFQWVDLGIVMTFLMVAVASNNELPDMLSLLEGATTANAFESQLQYKQWDPGNLEAQYKQWDPGNLEALPWPDGYSVLNKNKWKFTLEDLYSFQSSNQFIDNLQQVGRKVESCQGVIHVTTRFLYMNWSSTVLQPERSIAWGQAMFFGGGNVMPIHYNILGSADMGCGLTAMGLTCGVVTIRTKLRLRCQGIEEV
nr:uncharacterized protein LOC127296104 [Lolium perenne]